MRRLLPVTLLLVGVAVHGYRVIALHDDPQRGTAFARFATVDIAANRHLVVTAADDPGVVLAIPQELAAEARTLRVLPTDDGARRLAALLLARTWTVSGGVATAGAGEPLAGVRVQVVGPDSEGRSITRQVHTDVLVEGPRP